MPIFEYKCNDCGMVSEFLEKSWKAQQHRCSKCGSSNLQKMLSGFVVGQSKAVSSSCETCHGSQCQMDSCPSGICPYN